MARKAYLPPKLLGGPFTVDEAKRAGIDRWHLEGASWTRLGTSIYVRAGLDDDPMHRLAAVRLRLPAEAVFSGLTAAWLHGIDVAPCSPIEVTVPPNAGVSARAGIALRRSTFSKREIVQVRGFRATSVLRTVGEVFSRSALIEAVVIADAALHSRRVRIEQLASWADRNAGHRGVRNLREVLRHVDPAAESPMESRLRMVLHVDGLPRPQAQVAIHDRWGRFVGRVDLYYEMHRLGIEYDGAVHRETLAEDNRRQNRLLNAGVRLLRFTAADVLGKPEWVVGQVAAMLAEPKPETATAGARGY